MAQKRFEAKTTAKTKRGSASATVKGPVPDWTKADSKRPIFNKRADEYWFPVRTSHTSTGGDQLQDRLGAAAREGVEKLLEYYNKELLIPDGVLEIGVVERLLQHAEIKDWHLDPRPGCGGKLKVLISLPAAILDAIPQNLERFDFDNRDLTKVVRSVTLNTAKLRKQIKVVSKGMKKYARQIRKWPGKVRNLDLEKEAKRLSKTLPALKRFLRENKKTFREDHEDHIEIGFGENFKIEYVISFQSPGNSLRIGLNNLNETFPFSYPTTMGFLYYLGDMEKAISKNMSWTEFVTNFSYPVPEIKPGEVLSSIGNPSKALDRALDNFDASPIKALKKIDLEDKVLNDAAFKQQMFDIRSQATDFIGDNLMSGLREIIEDIETLDDVFETVLNKIDLSALSEQVMDSLASQIPTLDFTNSMVVGVLSNLSIGDLKTLVFPHLPMEVLDQINMDVYDFDLKNIDVEGFESSLMDFVGRLQDVDLLTMDDILLLIRNAMPTEKIVNLAVSGLSAPEIDLSCLPDDAINEFLHSAMAKGIDMNPDVLNPGTAQGELLAVFSDIVGRTSADSLADVFSEVQKNLLVEMIGCIPTFDLKLLLNLPSLIFDFKLLFDIPDLDLDFEFDLLLDALELYADLPSLYLKLPDLLPDIKIPNIDIPDLPNIPNLDIPDLNLDFSIPDIPDLSSFQFPDIPTFDLDPSWSGLPDLIKTGIMDMLEDILVETTKNVLLDLVDNFEGIISDPGGASKNLNFGAAGGDNAAAEGSKSESSIDILLNNSADNGFLNPAASPNNAAAPRNAAAAAYPSEVVFSVMEEFGFDSEYVSEDGDVLNDAVAKDSQDFLKRRSGRKYSKRRNPSKGSKFYNFVKDVSDMLTPSELSDLLSGTPKKEVLEVIKDCSKDNDINNDINNDAIIIDFFEKIGESVNPLILVDLKKPSYKISKTPNVYDGTSFQPKVSACNDGDLETIKSLLADKAGGITAEQIEEAAQKIIDRKKDKIKSLAALATKGNLLADMEKVSIFDGPDRLVKEDPASLKYLTKKTIDTIFNGADMSVSTDLSTLSSNFIKLHQEPLVPNVDYFISEQTRTAASPAGGSDLRSIELIAEKENSFKPVARVAPELYETLHAQNVVESRRIINPATDLAKEETSYSAEYEIKLPTIGLLAEEGAGSRKQLEKDMSDLRSQIRSETNKILNDPLKDFEIGFQESLDTLKAGLKEKSAKLKEFGVRENFGGPSVLLTFPAQTQGNSWANIKDTLQIKIDDLGTYRPEDAFEDNPDLFEIVSQYSLRGEAPAPQEVFARIFTEAWMSHRETYTPADQCDPEEASYYAFLGDYYEIIFRDTTKRFVREIGKSELFGPRAFEDFTTSLSIAGLDEADVGMGLDEKDVPKNSPFIDFERLKEKVGETYKQIREEKGLNSDAFERANIEGVLEAFVKVLGSEVIMRAAFALSVYEGIDISTDPVFEEVVFDLIYKELLKETGMERIFSKELRKTLTRRGTKIIPMHSKTTVQQDMVSMAREEYIEIFESISDAVKSLEVNDERYTKLLPLKNRLMGIDIAPRLDFIKTVDIWRSHEPRLFGHYGPNGKFSRELKETLGGVVHRGFIFEKYIRVQPHSQARLEGKGMPFGIAKGVVEVIQKFGNTGEPQEEYKFGIAEFEEVLRHIYADTGTGFHPATFWKLGEFFKSLKFGIRLSYVDAELDDLGSALRNAFGRVMQSASHATKKKIISSRAFVQQEKQFLTTTTRPVIIIPLLERETEANIVIASEIGRANIAEIPLQIIINAMNAASSGVNVLDIDAQTENGLKEEIYNDPKFKALFEYAIPVRKIMAASVLHSIVALTRVQQDQAFFLNARQTLQMLLRTLLGISDFGYQDELVDQLGGPAGFLKKQMNFGGAQGALPNLAAIAAKTPLYILKGLVEMIDPNISISSKMVMGAELVGEEYPGGSLGAALSLLPINVFPPIPFGPGLGPPITPPGFVYLALDGIRTPAEKAKKSISKKNKKVAEKLEEKAAELAERAAEEARAAVTQPGARDRGGATPPTGPDTRTRGPRPGRNRNVADERPGNVLGTDDPCD